MTVRAAANKKIEKEKGRKDWKTKLKRWYFSKKTFSHGVVVWSRRLFTYWGREPIKHPPKMVAPHHFCY
jgi:hypothetical protein